MRYVAIPRAWHNEWDDTTSSSRPSCDVVVTDDAPQATGILNADGVMLYRVQERVALGFKR